MPDVSLECTSNVLHFRLCRDSCVALCDLVLYLSSQRDLAPPPEQQPSAAAIAAAADDDLETRGSTVAHAAAKGESVGQAANIGDLISDAMDDTSPSTPREGSLDTGGIPTQFLPPPAAGKVVVEVSGGDALLMEFDSDSEEERQFGQPSPLSPSPQSPQVRTAGKRKMTDSLFSDSDEDDFCIVATPTSTRVVSISF